MVVTFDAYSETVKEHQEKKTRFYDTLNHTLPWCLLIFLGYKQLSKYKFIENKTKREEDEKGNKNKVISKGLLLYSSNE
jgi:hypothetical protein